MQRARQEEAIQAAWDAGNDFQLPMGRVDDALETDGLQQASLDAEIPATNRGFQMLQRMGWSQGKGLGAGEDGEHAHPPDAAAVTGDCCMPRGQVD